MSTLHNFFKPVTRSSTVVVPVSSVVSNVTTIGCDLSIKNAHPRDSRIVFDEGPHTYTVGKEVMKISVTGLVHNHFGKFDPEAVFKGIESKLNDPTYKYYGMTKAQILNTWKQSGIKASGDGTKMHNDIEFYLNGLEVENDSVEFQYFLNFRRDHPELIPYRTEWKVFYEELSIAGAIDMVFTTEEKDVVTGETVEKMWIYDWKRTKEFDHYGGGGNAKWIKYAKTPCFKHIPDTSYWHYVFQLNTYKKILELKYGKVISGLVLVRLHPDSPDYELTELPIMHDEIVDLFQLRRAEMGLEMDPTMVKTGVKVVVPKVDDSFSEPVF